MPSAVIIPNTDFLLPGGQLITQSDSVGKLPAKVVEFLLLLYIVLLVVLPVSIISTGIKNLVVQC